MDLVHPLPGHILFEPAVLIGLAGRFFCNHRNFFAVLSLYQILFKILPVRKSALQDVLIFRIRHLNFIRFFPAPCLLTAPGLRSGSVLRNVWNVSGLFTCPGLLSVPGLCPASSFRNVWNVSGLFTCSGLLSVPGFRSGSVLRNVFGFFLLQGLPRLRTVSGF